MVKVERSWAESPTLLSGSDGCEAHVLSEDSCTGPSRQEPGGKGDPWTIFEHKKLTGLIAGLDVWFVREKEIKENT